MQTIIPTAFAVGCGVGYIFSAVRPLDLISGGDSAGYWNVLHDEGIRGGESQKTRFEKACEGLSGQQIEGLEKYLQYHAQTDSPAGR